MGLYKGYMGTYGSGVLGSGCIFRIMICCRDLNKSGFLDNAEAAGKRQWQMTWKLGLLGGSGQLM